MSADQWIYSGCSGAGVRRWQEILLALGYDLGRWGADGVFGRATDAATRTLQGRLHIDVDGVAGPQTMAAAQLLLDGSLVAPEAVTPTVIDGIEVWDYRQCNLPAPKYGLQPRPWSQISGVMLHRTSCVLGERPARYWPVNAHVGVTMGGRIVLTFPWDRRIWHGNEPSPSTIGIELDGNPEGRPGYWWRPGGGPHPITDAQVRASLVLLDLLTAEFAAHGQSIQRVLAHRQSSADRECDPGWECWQKVALPWMERTGATPGQPEQGYSGATWGSGAPIPRDWDPRSPVGWWGR